MHLMEVDAVRCFLHDPMFRLRNVANLFQCWEVSLWGKWNGRHDAIWRSSFMDRYGDSITLRLVKRTSVDVSSMNANSVRRKLRDYSTHETSHFDALRRSIWCEMTFAKRYVVLEVYRWRRHLKRLTNHMPNRSEIRVKILFYRYAKQNFRLLERRFNAMSDANYASVPGLAPFRYKPVALKSR